MNIILQTIHFKASEQLQQFVNKKMQRIYRLTDAIEAAHVTLYEGANGSADNQFCEIKLAVPGNDIFVKKNAETYEKAILQSVEATQNIIRRRKWSVVLASFSGFMLSHERGLERGLEWFR